MAESLGNLLNQLFQRNGMAQQIQEYEAVNLWEQVVGEKIAKVTKAKDVRDGKLFVEVLNSIWRNELYYMKPSIIEKINKHIGKKIIHDIHLA